MLETGLTLVGFDLEQQARVQEKTNFRRFAERFGSSHVVCSIIWQDLQCTETPTARIDASSEREVDKFLIAMYYLYNYPKRKDFPTLFKLCEKTVSRYVWEYATNVQELKHEKVRPS
jgi:hypothetical protein